MENKFSYKKHKLDMQIQKLINDFEEKEDIRIIESEIYISEIPGTVGETQFRSIIK